jgi:hypothetical protein
MWLVFPFDVARSDMANIITGVDGQLYHGSSDPAVPPGFGRQGTNQRYPYTYNTSYDSSQYGSPRQRYGDIHKYVLFWLLIYPQVY